MMKWTKQTRWIIFLVGFLLTIVGICLSFSNRTLGDVLSRVGILVVWMAYYMYGIQNKQKQKYAYCGNILALTLILLGGVLSYTASPTASELLLHSGTITAIITWFVTWIG